MGESVAQFFYDVFKSEYLTVFLISIIPMIEVRGAIPIGVSMGMNIWVSYVFSVLSALVICPVLIFFLKPVLNALKKTKIFKKIAVAFEDMFGDKAKKINDKTLEVDENSEETRKKRLKNTLYKMLGVFMFVAIPLPMTGVWTGTAVAVFVGLKWYQSLLTVVVGNFFAGALITLLTLWLGDKSFIIILVLLGFVLISVVGLLVGMYRRNKKNKAVAAAENAEAEEAENKNDGEV